jgi:hypothetical protein
MHSAVPLPRHPGWTVARPSPTTTSGSAGPEPKEAIVFRVGEGEILVNVDGP